MSLLSDYEIYMRGIVDKGESVMPHAGKQHVGMLSWGFSSAGYDARLGNEFKVPDLDNINFKSCYFDPLNPCEINWKTYQDSYILYPGRMVLGITQEWFDIPNDLVGLVRDKSTLARLGIQVKNTVGEPGWSGHYVLEISNEGWFPIKLSTGMPICQIQFQTVIGEVLKPYGANDRYQNQHDLRTPQLFMGNLAGG